MLPGGDFLDPSCAYENMDPVMSSRREADTQIPGVAGGEKKILKEHLFCLYVHGCFACMYA